MVSCVDRLETSTTSSAAAPPREGRLGCIPKCAVVPQGTMVATNSPHESELLSAFVGKVRSLHESARTPACTIALSVAYPAEPYEPIRKDVCVLVCGLLSAGEPCIDEAEPPYGMAAVRLSYAA